MNGTLVNEILVDEVVSAVLYEGHILYPYRAAAKKRRQSSTFGRVYPESYCLAQRGAKPFRMQTQCLVEGSAARMNITVRFLHAMIRDIGILKGGRAFFLQHAGNSNP